MTLGVANAQAVEYLVTGTPQVGETYYLRLTQNSFTVVYEYTVVLDDTVEDVLNGLVEFLDDNYSKEVDGVAGTLRIASLGEFEVSLNFDEAILEDEIISNVNIDSTLFDDTTERNHNAVYSYVTGANREVKRPESQDVTIADDDAPGVLILQTRGSTDVIEPTELIRMGEERIPGVRHVSLQP